MENKLNVDEITKKLKQFENNKHIEIQKEILNDLKTFKNALIQDIGNLSLSPQNKSVNNKEVEKLNYRIFHLKNNFKELLENSENQKNCLKKENEKLNYRLSHLKISYQELMKEADLGQKFLKENEELKKKIFLLESNKSNKV